MAQREYERLTDSKAVQSARTSAAELNQFLDKFPKNYRVKVEIDGQFLSLPRQSIKLLRDSLVEMARGNAVTIISLQTELTTQQAADILNVSRPYLITVLEKGELPFTKVGTHRRIRFVDVMTYKESMKIRSSAAMDELVRIAQECELGY